jgi:two-component system, OmpR family, sensor kinase
MSVRTRLLLLFFVITAGAVVFVYLYVVPQLSSRLTAEKLERLQQVGAEHADRINSAIERNAQQAQLRHVIREVSQNSDGARVTVLGLRPGVGGLQPAFVIGDSQFERTALLPTYPAAVGAAAGGGASTAVERVNGVRIGETAIAGPNRRDPRWVTVLSAPLGDVDDNVALIRRQILIAGAIAICAALAAGWFAARAHSRRLRRLEGAAVEVAKGNFDIPIPVDSGDEVGQLALTFNEMQKRLARLDSARREFIANASHELRTPITSLGGFLELLEHDDPDPESRAEFMRTMRGQIDRLTKLTTDLLDLSKLDADVIEISPQPVELGPVIVRVAEEFGPAAERHSSTIDVGATDGVRVSADPERVAQILRILIDNALTHTPKGTAISVSANSNGSTAALTVSDDGPGIAARVHDRVFERFYTGDEFGGSGLGLAIARELALRMHGGLDLSSDDGRTEFSLELPIAEGNGSHA